MVLAWHRSSLAPHLLNGSKIQIIKTLNYVGFLGSGCGLYILAATMLLFGLPSLCLRYLSKMFLFVVWLSVIVVCLSINPVGEIKFSLHRVRVY